MAQKLILLVFVFLVIMCLGDISLAQNVQIVDRGPGYEICNINGQKFYRNIYSKSAFVTMEFIAEKTGLTVDSLKVWAFGNREKGLWRGEFTPLQRLKKVLPNYKIYAIFYPTSDVVDSLGYNPKKTVPLIPNEYEQEFHSIWEKQPIPNDTTSVKFGDLLEWMAFIVTRETNRVKKEIKKIYPNCYCLYFDRFNNFRLILKKKSLEWSETGSETGYGIQIACGNTYKRPTPDIPQQIKPEPKVQPEPELKPQVEVINRKFFAESVVFGGYSEATVSGGKLNSRFWYGGYENSLTFAKNRGSKLWLNLIGDLWGLRDNGKNFEKGFGIYLGPQLRFPINYAGSLKLGINGGYRVGYGRRQPFIRPRVNLEIYNLIWKFGFSTEWDYMYSLDKTWPEKLYFGNGMLFYSSQYGRKYGVGIEYAKIDDDNGFYWSSGSFLVGKIEGLFGSDWLHLIGKYRMEETKINHFTYPSQFLYSEKINSSRWMLLAVIVLKR